MILKIILLVGIVVAIIGVVGNLSPIGIMSGSAQSLYASVTTATFTGELSEIRDLLDDFLILREIRYTDDAETLAEKLDMRINNLELVKMHCTQKISTLDLAYEKNPYKKLQQLCPTLEDLSLSKAAQLFRLI